MKNKEIKRRFKQECFTPQCEKNIEQYGKPKEYLHSSYLAIDWMCEQFKSPWIKCSEKMPPFTEEVTDSEGDWEISDRVFVLCSDGGANINYWQHNITEATYSWNTKLDVVAWMPIPKFNEE